MKTKVAECEERAAHRRGGEGDAEGDGRLGGEVGPAVRQRAREAPADAGEEREDVGGDAERVERERGAVQRIGDDPALGRDHADRQ
jgi:hypothetical protein